MWYTHKRFLPGVQLGDGEMFSAASSAIIRRHPLVK